MINFLDYLFPRRCPVCDRVLPPRTQICTACERTLKRITEPYCLKCGKRLYEENVKYCNDCETYSHDFERGRALYEYGPIRKSVYRFKYGKRPEYARYYGKELARYLGNVILSWKPDAIVPVPLHRTRLIKRGYNQAELLSYELSKYISIPVRTDLIKRCKNTVPQKNLDAAGRQNNLKKAFKLNKNDVKLSTIVIIDDIYTTGSTIDAMAQVFKEVGVRNIYFITLSVGKG